MTASDDVMATVKLADRKGKRRFYSLNTHHPLAS